jgi:hypothetical protein
MDEGFMIYNVSCRSSTTLLNKVCRTCDEGVSKCISCYPGYYLLNNDSCVTSCSDASTYQTYSNLNESKSTCVTCTNYCQTCISQTQCLTCINISNYFLY